MYNLEIFFYGELISLVKENPLKIRINKNSVKDIIEGKGVPHTEAGKIFFNGSKIHLFKIINEDGFVDVYPVTPEKLEGDPKFILDVHLGTLARYLRMMGFDTLYNNYYTDLEIVSIALVENRIILTRDRGILKRKVVNRGYLIRGDNPRVQLHEVLKRYSLYGKIRPLTRCLKCNGIIEAIPKESVIHRVPEKSREAFKEFHICKECYTVYWKGSHYDRFKILIEEVKNMT